MIFQGRDKVLAIECQIPLRDRLNGLAGPLAFLEQGLRRLDHLYIVDILGSVEGSLGLLDNFHKGVEEEKVDLLIHGCGLWNKRKGEDVRRGEENGEVR